MKSLLQIAGDKITTEIYRHHDIGALPCHLTDNLVNNYLRDNPASWKRFGRLITGESYRVSFLRLNGISLDESDFEIISNVNPMALSLTNCTISAKSTRKRCVKISNLTLLSVEDCNISTNPLPIETSKVRSLRWINNCAPVTNHFNSLEAIVFHSLNHSQMFWTALKTSSSTIRHINYWDRERILDTYPRVFISILKALPLCSLETFTAYVNKDNCKMTSEEMHAALISHSNCLYRVSIACPLIEDTRSCSLLNIPLS